VIVAVIIGMAGFADPAIASAADECMHGFGSHQQLVDAAGASAQEWTVTNLKKSADTAPGYPLAGQLWEATASVKAVSGTVTPIIPDFSAFTADGRSYQVLWQLASPQGIPAATLAQGQTSTGKLYFDATGGDPVAVTYRDGAGHPLMWCSCDAMMAMPMRMPMENCPCCG
jgi:hypothetical protein